MLKDHIYNLLHNFNCERKKLNYSKSGYFLQIIQQGNPEFRKSLVNSLIPLYQKQRSPTSLA